MKLNQKQFETKIAERMGVSNGQAAHFVDTFKNVMQEELVAGNSINLTGFFHVLTRERHARTGINPQNPTERIQMPAVTVVKFRIGKTLRLLIKG